MIRPIVVAAVLAASSAPMALAQTAPVPAAASDAAPAERLRAVEALAPRDAEARLKAQAEAGDEASREILAALGRREAAVKLESRLLALDPTGATVERFRDLARTLAAAHRGDAAAAKLDDKALGPLPDAPNAPEEEVAGWEHRTEAFAGTSATPSGRVPAAGFAQESEYNRGPWRAELGARALFAPGGRLLPSDGTVEAKGSRRIGEGPFRLFAGAELHRDDRMGLATHLSLHGGVEAEILDSERQQLSAGFGVGAATEKHLTGESEKHPLTLSSLEYALKITAKAVVHLEAELESNPLARSDYELKTVGSVVYDVSKNLAVRLARQLTVRGEPVDGYAGRRSETTLGLIIHP